MVRGKRRNPDTCAAAQRKSRKGTRPKPSAQKGKKRKKGRNLPAGGARKKVKREKKPKGNPLLTRKQKGGKEESQSHPKGPTDFPFKGQKKEKDSYRRKGKKKKQKKKEGLLPSWRAWGKKRKKCLSSA